MGHTYTTIRVHVVFSTAGRRPLLEPAMQPRVWDYIGGIGRNHGIPIHQIGGIDNHVHILMSVPDVGAGDNSSGQGHSNPEGVFFEMAERNSEQQVRLAGRVRGFFGKPVQCG